MKGAAVQLVRQRIGPAPTLRAAPHWINGREGLTWFVDRPIGPSVFKFVEERELSVMRDLLPTAPIHTPRLLRTWPADENGVAAVEMEYIPNLASARPCYRFVPQAVPLADPAWTGGRLDSLIDQLADMHAQYSDGRCLGPHSALLNRASQHMDWSHWQTNLEKLAAVANHFVTGHESYRFWSSLEPLFKKVLDDLYMFPLTWHWSDAKWDHIGCRANGQVLVLEWSTSLGPAGSDLFLLLFLPPQRRDALLNRYRNNPAAQSIDLRSTLLGLLRACFMHGPGQSTLSLRGVSGGQNTPADLAAWARDAEITAAAIDNLRTEIHL